MASTYTARYIKTGTGYMGQLMEWPEGISEGKTLEECRECFQDAMKEMINAYRQKRRASRPGCSGTDGGEWDLTQ